MTPMWVCSIECSGSAFNANVGLNESIGETRYVVPFAVNDTASRVFHSRMIFPLLHGQTDLQAAGRGPGVDGGEHVHHPVLPGGFHLLGFAGGPSAGRR